MKKDILVDKKYKKIFKINNHLGMQIKIIKRYQLYRK